MKDFCGIFGAWNDNNAAESVYIGLYALQHRGQESAGIVSSQGNKIFTAKGMGLRKSGLLIAGLGVIPGLGKYLFKK